MKNEIMNYDGITEAERIEGINLNGKKAFQSLGEYAVASRMAGDMLTAQKNTMEHGHWLPWIDENVKTLGQQWCAEAMKISNYARERNLTNDDLRAFESRRKLLAAMADDNPRKQRRTGQVEVIEPGQQPVQADEPEPDDDPTPAPPTNQKASAGNRKKPESTKPETQTIVPEIVDAKADSDPVAEWIGATSLTDVVARWVDVSVDPKDEKRTKEVANRLRKLADKLDPPTKFVPPTVEEVSEYCREKGYGIDAEDFVANGQAYGWVDKNKRKYKDWRGVVRTWVAFEKKHNGNGRSVSNGKQQSHADRIAAIVAATFG